jgi:hypothetical protein
MPETQLVDWAGYPPSSSAHPTGYLIFNYAHLLSCVK